MGVAKLFDTVQERFKIKNDAAMCRELEVQQALVSKMRNGKLPLNPVVILKIHEYLGVPVKKNSRAGSLDGSPRIPRYMRSA